MYSKYAVEAVGEGLISEKELDERLYTALLMRFRLGLFDPIED